MTLVYTERQPQPEELLRGVPEEVIALLGAEGSIAIEEHIETLHTLGELMALPDPMNEDFPIQSELELSESIQDATKHAVLEIGRVKPLLYKNPLTEEASKVAAESTPVVRDALTFLLGNLGDVRAETADQCAGLSIWQIWLKAIDDEDVSLVVDEARQLHEELMNLASQLPYPKISEDIELLVKSELLAVDIGTVAVGAQTRPDLLRTLRKQRKANTLGERVLSELRAIGRDNPEIADIYRPEAEIHEDLVRRNELIEYFSKVRKRGTALHNQMNGMLGVVAGKQVNGLLGLLGQLYDANREAVQQSGEQGADTDNVLARAVTIEEYIATHAEALGPVLGAVKFRFTSEVRQTLRTLADRSVTQAMERALQERTSAQAEQPTQVPTDNRFRQACKEAKDILRGGSRLKYPNAQKIASDLHNLRFDEEGNVRLEQGEGGLIIAILAGRISDFVDTVKRVNLSPNRHQDIQVQRLQSERFEQFTAIKEFDLVASIYKLEHILDNPHYRNRLVNILSSNGVGQVQTKIKALAQEFRQAKEKQPQEAESSH